MASKQHIFDWLADTDCEVMRLEPASFYDTHIAGVGYHFTHGPVLIYRLRGILNAHVEQDGMTPEEAREYFEFNTLGAWVGAGTPMFIDEDPTDAPL
jgi:hypothetical protein